jgi:prepilin-type N-terminal cleavage/methylation domain-containing protein/prepilin-type processing-associated H-X9-DG protein
MRRLGFTLIELLVVIAIIAILAAILFPVFARAREKARQTACTSNLKQLSLGVLMYVQDYDEMFPPNYSYAIPGVELRWWEDLIQPYVKNWQLTICPSSTIYTYTYCRPPEGPNPLQFTYGANAMSAGPPGSGTGGYGGGGVIRNGVGTPQAAVVAPSECIMLCETIGQRELTRAERVDCWDADNGYIRKDHNEMANWAFCDGHVKTLRESEPHMWSITNQP